MMAAPPLILYGTPYLPLLHSLPRRVLKHGLGPLLAWSVWHRCGRWLMHPLVCWLAFVLTNLLWHMPALYELALRSQYWHEVQHLCFFCSAMLFWWPVIQPWPSQPRWPRWAMIPYLFFADFQNTALSAFLVFCERVVYPTYATAPRLWEMSALDDQAAAGAIMWVCGSLAFLLPLGVLTINVFGPHRRAVRPSSARARLQATKGGQS
jgi:cytochrome c oxidase assembly factor CtaG